MKRSNEIKVFGTNGQSLQQMNPMSALSALNTIVQSTFDYLNTKEQHISMREEMRANRDVNLRKIEESSRILTNYLNKEYEQRKIVLEGLLSKLDTALETGNSEASEMVLSSIIGVVKINPLINLKMLNEDIENNRLIEI